MAEEELTHGEIARTLKRHDDELAKMATREALAEFKGETREKFMRAEALAVERRDALALEDRQLGERIDGIEKTRTSKAANWIALGVLVVTALSVLVTVLVSHGGK